MKNREIFFKLTLQAIRRSEAPAMDDIALPWNILSQRIDTISTGYVCLSTACVLRDYYEEELKVDPTMLQFKAVVDEHNNLWHVWLEHEGRIVDTEPFKKMYKRMYALGENNSAFEKVYQNLKSTPVMDGLSMMDLLRLEIPNI